MIIIKMKEKQKEKKVKQKTEAGETEEAMEVAT